MKMNATKTNQLKRKCLSGSKWCGGPLGKSGTYCCPDCAQAHDEAMKANGDEVPVTGCLCDDCEENKMRTTTTTDLTTIRNLRRTFTWGKISKIHDIGSYSIVEYIDDATKDVLFHVYVDGKNTHTTSETLERALVLAIAHKNLEVNLARFMAIGANKLLGIG